MKFNISIIGLGYIGLPFALLLSKKGFNINGVDVNKKKIETLNKGKFISEEADINKLYKLSGNNISYSTKLFNSKFYILCLPTPINKNLKCDLSFLIDGLKQISKVIKINDTIIVESTVPIGTTSYLFSLMCKLRPDLKDNFNIGFSPEKAIPGNTLNEMQNNYRIIGSNKKTFNLVRKIYSKFSKNKIYNYKIEEAEASKLIENSFRDNQLAFSNYLDSELRKRKLNFKKISEICNLHPRVNLLKPSIGVGGHCIPIDPYFLNFKAQKDNMILMSRRLNDKRTSSIATKLKKLIRTKKKVKICLWGLGYKPGSTDLRESPAIKIINLLKNNKFYISDPYYYLINKNSNDFKNFLHPNLAFKKCKFHIILNLESKYLKNKFNNCKYILAEDL